VMKSCGVRFMPAVFVELVALLDVEVVGVVNNELLIALMLEGSAAGPSIYEKSNAVIYDAASCAEARAESALTLSERYEMLRQM